jgi:Ca-activated chloride channel homolog
MMKFFTRHRLFLILFSLLPIQLLWAQQTKDELYVQQGNQLYKKGKYKEAEIKYKQALKINKDNLTASYNLGDALYKQKKYQDATNVFEQITYRTTNKDTLAKTYHNLGNAHLQQQKYEESVKAYKKSLKYNPNDEETRYNLAYANAMLKKQQQQQQQKQEQKKKEEEKKKQEQKKPEPKDDQENKEKTDKQETERILNSLDNDEKDVQKRLKGQQQKGGQKQPIDKDW